jgi:DNA-binding transcriptional ArsR family regulator
MLREGKMSAGDIGQRFEIAGATVSYHLSLLKKAGLILESKYKNFVYYELNASVFDEVMLWFSQFKGDKEKNEQE